MTLTHGFELIREQLIPELNTKARFFRHVETGAELLSMENDDENKVFGISFCTPPADSTGVSHIMEHSVLCGSRKYPVREPFVELVKGSLQTFLNAVTFPDKTCYPVASQNVQDFYNLIDVYLDAVFYPRISPATWQQEGWHYELDDLDAPLTFKGVVFNEMKGAYSDPDNLLARYAQQSVFPDNTYGVDSGGDPKVIPNLTYEQFKNFHHTYYHPSNARLFFYGDDNSDERLRIVQEYLKDFAPLGVSAAVALQPRLSQPRRLVYGYDAGEGVDGRKGMLTINWLLSEVTDAEATLAHEILNYILIGTPASPLRKALIDSGRGEDLAGVGLDADLRQIYFSTGLKGIAAEDADRVEKLIFDTLQTLAQDGIDPDMVEAALNTTEFVLRENNTGSWPRGLILMFRSLRSWLYHGDPVAPLAFEAPLAAIKTHLAANKTYFEDLIAQYLLSNTHRATVILKPEPGLRQKEEAEEKERLDRARAAMSPKDLRRVMEETRQLKLAQETPDTPEALATIPSLQLEDLDKQNKLIPLNILESSGIPVLYHDLFTNGIVYLDLGFNLYTLPPKYLPYVALFGRALLEMGTDKEDFVKLSQRIGRKTGGIYPTSFASTLRESEKGTAWLFWRGKATVAQTDDLLAILRDVLLTAQLDNQERFRQLVLEEKASEEASLVPGGHQVVISRVRSHFNEADWAAEQISGIDYLFFLRQLAETVEHDWSSVLGDLETIRRLLINRSALICNVTLDQPNWKQVEPKLNSFLPNLPAAPFTPVQWTPTYPAPHEGLTIPAQVNYVGKGANLYRLGYRLDGSILPITHYLRTTWLWERVRVQGGAYGGFCRFDPYSGVFVYASYRDPNLLGTLDIYDQTAQFLHQLDLSSDELTKSIIGAIGQMDAYQLPDAKGYTSMLRYLAGDTDEKRQRLRDEVLSTTGADFRKFADVLEQVKTSGLVAVLGPQEMLDEANRAHGGSWLQVSKVL